MELLNQVFLKVLNMSITAGYIIIAILIVRQLIKKSPKVFSYSLWIAAAFRLICPVSFSSFISIFNIGFFDMSRAQTPVSGALTYIPDNKGNFNLSEITTGISVANNLIREGLTIHSISHSPFQPLPVVPGQSAVEPISGFSQVIINTASIIWIVGIMVLLTYSIVSYIKLRKRVSRAVLLEGSLYECENIPSPFVLGFLKPRIYLPFRMNGSEKEYILKHEEYHIKRLDHIIRPMSFLLMAIYWFNPLVWIAYFCSGRDMEMSCDEHVLSVMGPSIKKDYSLSLLSFAVNRRFHAASLLAFGESNARKRVKNVLSFKKPKAWLVIVMAIVCIAAIAAFAANPIFGKQSESTDITSIFGKYKIRDLVYHSLLSSATPDYYLKQHKGTTYEITNKAFIVDPTRSPEKSDITSIEDPIYEKIAQGNKIHALGETIDFGVIDLSSYDRIEAYKVADSAGADTGYRIFLLDNEVWIGHCYIRGTPPEASLEYEHIFRVSK